MFLWSKEEVGEGADHRADQVVAIVVVDVEGILGAVFHFGEPIMIRLQIQRLIRTAYKMEVGQVGNGQLDF